MPAARTARSRRDPAARSLPSSRNGHRAAPRTEFDAAAPESAAEHLPRALRAIGSVVAPASLITALLFYFGVQHAHWYFHYFGINHTVMGLTTQDYLIRSADG